jgi:MoaA/NifB/PqqE/SkfB family radical SAM enzyme
MNIPDSFKRYGMNKVYGYLDRDPVSNLPKLMDWVDRVTPADLFPSQKATFRNVVDDPDNNFNVLLQNVWRDVDPHVREVFFNNFLINANLLGWPRQEELRNRYQCNIPWAILLDPTSACNLHCTGCWAAEYGNKLNLNFDEIDHIIEQGKELGIYLYIYTGGEPLVRKQDLIALCNKHHDCEFMAFTNGTLIDEEFADDLLRVGNFVPVISVEGFEEATDRRRGDGTFARVERAMKILKDHRLPFGISCCYTAQNVEVIGSEAYFDQMIEWGAFFAWFFTYMPVGASAVPELMVNAAQREFMYHQIREFRQSKPLLTMDFWNDGEFVGGCIAGGRRYLHINANGDIDPCVFAHYSDSNIREKPLLEAFRSPLFMAYHDNQPFNDNMLRPCPILDNPGRLTTLVEQTGAVSTDLESPESCQVYSDRCVPIADRWAPTAERLWRADPKSKLPNKFVG